MTFSEQHATTNGHALDFEPAEPKLRVCVLAACPFPANHGTPGSIREMAEATAQRGHEVHVVTYHFGEDIPLRDVHLHRIKPLTGETEIVVGPTVRRPLYDLQMVWEAIRVVRKHKIDLVHAHNYEGGLVAALCRMVTGCPFVYSAHNTMGDELASYDFFKFKWMANGLASVLDAVVPRLGNRCIPHSENLRKFLHGKGLEKRCDPVLNFGIEIDLPSPGDGTRLVQRYELGAGPVILYAGVMDHFQRLDLLLEAMKSVTFYEPDAKLVLVVTVPNEAHERELRENIQRLGLERNVVITDPQDLDGVREFLQICDVAVVPRPGAPGFPIKLLNYMANRRACVMFDSSASGLTHEQDVWLASPDTSEALAEGIMQVLRDDQLRTKLAEGGYRFVSEHHDRRLTSQRVCESYVRLLQDTSRWEEIVTRPRVMTPKRRIAAPLQASAATHLSFAASKEIPVDVSR